MTDNKEDSVTQGICDAAVVAACFSPDKTQLAFSPNNHLVYIVDVSSANCTNWKIAHVINCHDQAVTGIDWSPVTGKLLTAAQDRAAFVHVFREETGRWEQQLVLLDTQIKRGLTCGKWSVGGEKLYIGSAANNVAVAKYDDESAWWRCTVITPHVSGITCIAPHPLNDAVIATGGHDCCIKISSTYTKNIDKSKNRLGKCGAELGAFQLNAWVLALAWAPKGNTVAAVTRDSSVYIVEGEDALQFEEWTTRLVALRGLPCRTLAFLGDHAIIAGGHDFYPLLLLRNDEVEEDDPAGGWHVDMIGIAPQKKKQELTATQAAKLKFQNQAALGQDAGIDLPDTRHTNTIISVLPLCDPESGAPFVALPKATKNELLFATCSLDGKVELWGADDLVSASASQ